MSQTSIERLRDYLAQLPPQAQALLMREFERALERGQDTAVATLVLEQLRKIVRKTEADEAAPPRTDDLSRLLFRIVEPFLVEAGAPIRVGQIRRSSLNPIWQWLGRDGAPDKINEFEAVLARMPATDSSGQVEALTLKLQAVAADAIFQLTGPGGGDKSRALARVGPPNVIEDLYSIGAVLAVREAMATLNEKLPRFLRTFGDPQIASVTSALNIPVLQTPQMLPFALSLVVQRMTAPWQIIRLAIKIAASDDEIRVAATPYGVAVTMALHDLSRVAANLRMDIKRGHFETVADNLKALHDGVRGLRTELDLRNDSPWGKQLTSIRADISNALQSEIDSVPGRVRRILRQRPEKDIPPGRPGRYHRSRGNRRADRLRRHLSQLCQRACDQRGDAAYLFRPAAICGAVDRAGGAVAARRRSQGSHLPSAAGAGRDPLLPGAVRRRLRLADEPCRGERGHGRAKIDARKLIQVHSIEITISN
ncbi:hypothetical protein ACVW16_006173 [Bradyrhizobium sp. USDA 4474]